MASPRICPAAQARSPKLGAGTANTANVKAMLTLLTEPTIYKGKVHMQQTTKNQMKKKTTSRIGHTED